MQSLLRGNAYADAILGDLAEDSASIEAVRGAQSARRWYRSQVVRSLIPLVRSARFSAADAVRLIAAIALIYSLAIYLSNAVALAISAGVHESHGVLFDALYFTAIAVIGGVAGCVATLSMRRHLPVAIVSLLAVAIVLGVRHVAGAPAAELLYRVAKVVVFVVAIAVGAAATMSRQSASRQASVTPRARAGRSARPRGRTASPLHPEAGRRMQSLFRDIRYGMRSLLNTPGLTIIAVLALTLGIGLTTMMFSLVYGTMLRGLPFPDGDRIMVVQRTNPARDIDRQPLPIQDYFDYRAQQHSFTDLGAFTSGSIAVSGDEKAERFDGSWITANTFGILGVPPVLGRPFRAGEDSPSGEKVAIIAFSVWKDRYASDPAIVGKRIRVNGVPHTIVGVMPERFAFPINDRIWLPLQADPLATPRGKGPLLHVFGKLAPGVTREQAAVDVATIARRLAAEYKASNAGFGALVQSFTDSYVGKGQLLYTMLGAVVFVLLIACTNVANLLLGRAAYRTKEVGIRIALGASRTAVVRQFLAESLVLSLISTALGVGVAQLGVGAFNRAIANTLLPFFIDIQLHPQVLLFTILIAAATTLFAGVIPAIQSSRTDINEVLKDETRGASSFRIGRISKLLVMFEVALSCSLLVAAGLMIRSVANMRIMDRGFTSKNVFTARVGFPTTYTDTLAEWRFFDDVVERVVALPGVQTAALSSGLPAADPGFGVGTFAIEGKAYLEDKDYPSARAASVTPRFFDVIGTPMFSGRGFTDADRPGALPVVIVNRAFAKKYFLGAEPLGRRLRIRDTTNANSWLTVVGVVGNTFTGNQDTPMEPALFRPMAQARSTDAYITAKTVGPPLSITQGVRDAVATLNADLPVFWAQSFDDAIAVSLWFLRVRVMGTLFIIFGFVALFLASVGLYAVMSFSVSRRTREMGIRMALGARRGDVVRMILGQGALQLSVGMAVGLALAFAISNLLRSILLQVDARDPLIFGGVAGVLVLVGLVACVVPARRATRIDPVVALRAE